MAHRRLMCILAHPDDESMGMGATLARYAAEGVAVSLVTATRGERGWHGPAADNPGLTALGRIREAELCAAARVLGLHEVQVLDHIDGNLDQADPAAALPPIVGALRRARPQVVVTFAPDGAYGHPDHIAISQLTMAAIVAAADAAYADPDRQPAHRVAKLYYMVEFMRQVEHLIGALGFPVMMEVDGISRGLVAWPDWAITTRIDATAYWQTAWRAVQCHRSQLVTLGAIDQASDEVHQAVWGKGTFYRAFSLVNGGRALEDDLFAGLT